MPRLNPNEGRDLDREIVVFLEQNPQAVLQDIARCIGRGYSATRNRVEKLIGEGVLMRMIRVLKPTLPLKKRRSEGNRSAIFSFRADLLLKTLFVAFTRTCSAFRSSI